MRNRFFSALAVGLIVLVSIPAVARAAQQSNKAQTRLEQRDDRQARQTELLKEEVRHQLVTMPYYSVFDWLGAEIKPDGTVTLNGQVTQPTIKNDALSRVKRLEGATSVVDNIEVLPLSNVDDQLRVALYRAIYKYDSPLFRYALQSVGPIHIIVKNGRVTLKGIVSSPMDKQLAYMAANGVPGVFQVTNELQVEESSKEKLSKK
jgi:hyperosmotically inducible periplasmic protein